MLVTGPENRPATYHLFFIKQGQDNEYKYIYPSGQLGLFYKEVPIVQADFANILAAGQEKVYTELEKILEAICNESERSNT